MGDFSEEFSIELGLRLKKDAIDSIQKQLNQLSGRTIDINIGGNVNTSEVKNEVEKAVNEINKTTQEIKPIKLLTSEDRKGFEGIIDGIISDEKELEKSTRDYFKKFGNITTRVFRDSGSKITGFIVDIKNAQKEVESLKYSYAEETDKSTGEVSFSGYRYRGSVGTDNYVKSIEQAIKKEQAHQQQVDRNNASMTKYRATLDSLQSKYKDKNASKAIIDGDHQSQLSDQYNTVVTAIDTLENADKNTFASMKANVDAEISKLRNMITEFQNAEYAATKLRAKPIEVIRQDEINSLREFEARIKQSGVDLSSFNKIGNLDALSALREMANNITNKEELTAYLNVLTNVKTEWKALVQERKVDALQQKELDNDVNNDYQALLAIIKEIGNIKIELLSSDPKKDSEKIAVLNQRLSELQKTYNELYEVIEIFASKVSGDVLGNVDEAWSKINQNIDLAKAKLADKQESKNYSQMQKEAAEKTKLALQEEENEYKNLISLAKEAGKIRTTMIGLDPQKDSQQIAFLKEQFRSLYTEFLQSKMVFATNFPTHSLDELNAAWRDVISNIDLAKAKASDAKQKLANDIRIKLSDNTLENQVSSIESKFARLHINSEEINNDFSKLRRLLANMDDNDDIESVTADYQKFLQELTKVENKVAELQRQRRPQQNNARIENQRITLNSQIDTWLNRNTAAARQFGDVLEDIKSQISSADQIKLTQLKSQFQDIKRQAELAGKTGLSFTDSIKSKIKQLGTYFSASMIISKGVQSIRKMYDNVLQVDTAMTELYRVTDLSSSQYQKLYDNMVSSAKKYGATLDSIINSTASWVRLGFDAETSNKLAEITTMYQHVTDLDEGTAVKNLVTAYKGYQNQLLSVTNGDSAKAVLRVADIYDALGNKMPVTAAQVGEGLTKWASVAEQAGASIEQASALIVGGGSITQDFDAMGNALKISTLRIRGKQSFMPPYRESLYAVLRNIKCTEDNYINQSAKAA